MKNIKTKDRFFERRNFIKSIGFFGLFASIPAYAFDLFKIIDPEGKNEELQRAQKIMQGAGNIFTSSSEINYNTEFSLGESLALEGLKKYGMPVQSKKLQKYVNLLGSSLAQNSQRPEITYYFIVVKNNLYNAFSCPGGIIIITSTLMKLMNDESELAGVLAHELAHVSHKHALSALKRSKLFDGILTIASANSSEEKRKKYQETVGSLQTILFDKGLDKNMEFEADITGMETSYRTGYDPGGLIRVLNKLKSRENNSQKAGSWFSTHPPIEDRIQKCRQKLNMYSDASHLARVKNRFIKKKGLIY